MACQRSQSCCRPSQKSALIPRTRDRRNAVSGVTERLPLIISFSRGYDTPRRRASSACVRPSGLTNSSRSISPGCVGGRFRGSRRPTALSVVVCDFDFAGMTILPDKTNAVLLIDANTVLALPVSQQRLQAVAGGYFKFTELPHPVYLIQFSTGNWPERLGTALSS